MNLKTFVGSVLRDIVSGVKEANAALDSNAPSFVLEPPNQNVVAGSEPDCIDFDVAVTVSESSTAKGGGELKVLGIISGGGGAEKVTSAESISRVRFRVRPYNLLGVQDGVKNIDYPQYRTHKPAIAVSKSR